MFNVARSMLGQMNSLLKRSGGGCLAATASFLFVHLSTGGGVDVHSDQLLGDHWIGAGGVNRWTRPGAASGDPPPVDGTSEGPGHRRHRDDKHGFEHE